MAAPLRVLIAEDSVRDAELVVLTLEGEGFAVAWEAVASPEALAAALDQQPWDIILSDASMPGFSATAALALVKERGLDIPFIIVSGSITEEAASAAMRLGAQDFLSKQNLARLAPAVQRELDEAAVRRQRRQALAELRESEARYRRIVETAQEGIWQLDAENRTTFVNPRMAEMLGYSVAEMQGKPLWTFLEPDLHEQARREITSQRDGTPLHLETRFRHRDGRTVWARIASAPLLEPDGSFGGLLWMIRDITARKQAADAARRWSQQQAAVATLGTLALAAGDPQAVFAAATRLVAETMGVAYGTVLEVLPNGQTLLLRAGVGWESALIGQATLDADPQTHAGYTLAVRAPVIAADLDDEQHFRQPALLRERGIVSGLSALIHSPQGSFGLLLAHSTSRRAFSQDDMHFLQAMAHLLSLTVERHQSSLALRRQAEYDALTGLPNRMLFLAHVQQALDAAADQGGATAVLLLDINRFKEVNDTLGHANGDLLLQQLAGQLWARLHDEALVARLGGDEFAFLLRHIDGERARATAHTIRDVLAEPCRVAEVSFDVEASIGIALGPDHGTDAHALLRHADVALHAAKRARADIAVYTPKLDTHSPDRLALLGDLRRGIGEGQLFLVYQPQLRLAEGRVSGAEALVRWQHPRRGLIPPDQFIGLAEGTGAIGPLTLWVLEAAIRQCGAWRRAGLALPVSVNISARNLHDGTLPTAVSDLLVAYQVPPAWLTLEITESAIMDDPGGSRAMLTQFSTMGVKLEIDDFGTGYSSLGYLKRLPVDGLKVDRTFVQHLGMDEDDATIVASTVGLAHNLGLHVVAEGVENQTALQRLGAMGCDVAQGYHLSRPVAAEALERWLRDAPWPVAGQGSSPSAIHA